MLGRKCSLVSSKSLLVWESIIENLSAFEIEYKVEVIAICSRLFEHITIDYELLFYSRKKVQETQTRGTMELLTRSQGLF